eukprot:6703740-Prymnesium_polylepis.1
MRSGDRSWPLQRTVPSDDDRAQRDAARETAAVAAPYSPDAKRWSTHKSARKRAGELAQRAPLAP